MKKAAFLLAMVSIVFMGFKGSGSKLSVAGNYHLFNIDRSRSADIVMYDVNLDNDGILDHNRPIRAYWIKRTENNQLQPLTLLEEKLGYGLDFSFVTDDVCHFEFVSSSVRTFELRRDQNNTYKVYTTSNQMNIEVNSIYVKFANKSLWFPVVAEVELHGIDTESGKPFEEIFYP